MDDGDFLEQIEETTMQFDRILAVRARKFLEVAKPFLAKPYGLELLIILNEDKCLERRFGIDECYGRIRNFQPRRETFGNFMRYLIREGCIFLEENEKNRRSKFMVLSDEYFIKIGKYLIEWS
jgi:hypothetical protein